MAFPYSDCECVQGIEYFIDPRHYTPWEENGGVAHIELPWWQRRINDALAAKAAEDAASSTSNNSSSSAGASQRTATLVLSGTTLINKGFIHLVAHQIKSFYLSVETLDEDWQRCDISLNFKHLQSGKQVIVPILGLGAKYKVAIPYEVLQPGTLLIAAIGTVLTGDYEVLSTESLRLRVYDPQISSVKWPELKRYDVYFEYQRMMKSVLEEVEFLTNDAIKAVKDNDKGIELVWGVTDSDGVLCSTLKTEVIPLVHTENGKLVDKDGTELLTMPLHIGLTGVDLLNSDLTPLNVDLTTTIEGVNYLLRPQTYSDNVKVGEIETLEQRLETINTEFETVNAAIETEKSERKSETAALRSEIATLKAEISRLNDAVTRLNDELSKSTAN